ncbi:MAG: MATE family efflux transporter [Phycisphaerales bacterium]|nr:MATE family efflux transporter [Phycisphaerales bacterium]
MTATHRIIVNALATYGRTVFAMALGLFSSRWVLASLGKVDYGLLAVVGGLIVFVTFLNNVTSSSCARFFALSIGKGDPEETNRWFNTALSIHTILPSILVLLGWPLGEWAIGHFLNIPPNRLDTAHWVFRFSLVSAFWGMSTTPYMAMFTAKQHIAEMSVWGILGAIANFCFVYWLTTYKGDAWLVYAGFTVLFSIFFGVCQVLRARHLFPECRIFFSKWYERRRLTEVFSFASWSLLGNLAVLLRNSGTAIVLNKFFPPVRFPAVNASYSVGNTVSAQTISLSGAFMGALSPEITSTFGRGDLPKAISHSWRASKFAVFLISFLAIPLLVEMDYVLRLWLRNPPEYASAFCALMLISLLIDNMSVGQMILVNASGRIQNYQLTIGSIMLATLPLACIFILCGMGPLSVTWAYLTTAFIASSGRAVWCRYLFKIPFSTWLKLVVLPCTVLGGGTYCVGLFVRILYDAPSFMRLISVVAATSLVFGLGVWNFGLRKDEKKYILHQAKALYSKITGKKNNHHLQPCGQE